MEERSYIKVDGTIISEAMKKLDELWRNVGFGYYGCVFNLTDDNSRKFFESGVYHGASMMATFLFGPDFKMACVPESDGMGKRHYLEVIDETDLR